MQLYIYIRYIKYVRDVNTRPPYIYTYTHTHIYTHTYISFFRFFSIIGYYKTVNIVPCAIQQVLDVNLFYKY